MYIYVDSFDHVLWFCSSRPNACIAFVSGRKLFYCMQQKGEATSLQIFFISTISMSSCLISMGQYDKQIRPGLLISDTVPRNVVHLPIPAIGSGNRRGIAKWIGGICTGSGIRAKAMLDFRSGNGILVVILCPFPSYWFSAFLVLGRPTRQCAERLFNTFVHF